MLESDKTALMTETIRNLKRLLRRNAANCNTSSLQGARMRGIRYGVWPVAISLLLALGGCAASDGRNGIREGAANAEPVSLKISAWGSLQEAATLRGLLRNFERTHPKIRVTLMHIPDNYYQKLHLLIASDQAPDVMLTNSLNFPVYAAHGAFLDLAPRLAVADRSALLPSSLSVAHPAVNKLSVENPGEGDETLHASDFYPAALQAFSWEEQPTALGARSHNSNFPEPIHPDSKSNSIKLEALPRDISNLVVFYNRDRFQKAGLSEPTAGWTWDDLKRTASRLTQDSNHDSRPDTFGFSFYAKPPLFWLPFVWSAGGELFSADLERTLLDQPATLYGLQFYADLRHRWHAAPKKSESGDAAMTQLFLQQKLAMMVSGRWSVPVLREQAHFSWDVVPLPVGPSGKSRVGIDASGYAISAKTPHPEAAWALVRFLGSRQAIAKIAESGLIVPARPDVAESGLFQNARPGAKTGQGKLSQAAVLPPAHGHVFLDVIPDGVPSHTPPRWNEFAEELQLALEPVWDGEQSAKTAIQAAMPRLQRILRTSP
jgi:multiple sugar transport system substrate-binding protein